MLKKDQNKFFVVSPSLMRPLAVAMFVRLFRSQLQV